MQIFVKTLNGETRVLSITEAQSALELKEQCALIDGVDVNLLNFVCEGSIISDCDVLCNKLQEQSTVYVTLGLDGGKKKKKKRVPATKKKNKHKHQSEKLHTLRYYSVDEKTGKISYQRRICPKCESGYAMAKHFDRHYCGKCHVSLKLDAATIKANQEQLKKKQAEKAKAAAIVVDDGKGKAKAGVKTGDVAKKAPAVAPKKK